ILVQLGCRSMANPQKEMTITTKSDEARKIFLDGRQMFENIRFNESRDYFSQAIKEDPDFAFAHLYYAFTAPSAMVFQKHLQKAVALKSEVSEGERLMIEAVQAGTKNNPLKAMELWQQLVQKFPKDKRVHYFLGANYYGRDEDDKAIAEFSKVIKIDKDFAPVYNLLGYTYREKEDYEKSEEAFKNYIDLLPDEANPHDSLADLYTKMGKHEDAIKHYKKAIALNPKFAFSQRKIGTNMMFMGKYDEARDAFRKAMEMEVTPAGKITSKGMIGFSYLYQDNHQEALANADEAIKMAAKADLPEIAAGIHSGKCRVYIETGNLDAAEKSVAECRKVVEGSELMASIKENFAKQALFDETLIAAKQKDFKIAMAKADEHKAKIEAGKDPKEMENHHELLGYVYFEKGDYAKSIEHLKQADQENPFALYYLAVAESKAGDKVKAAELFKQVANWNENSLNYALVRSKAIMEVKQIAKKE
ncbi:MAG: tetratricopeptide repeat protein, partial [bacterium]